jgi:hypothetical protein
MRNNPLLRLKGEVTTLNVTLDVAVIDDLQEPSV